MDNDKQQSPPPSSHPPKNDQCSSPTQMPHSSSSWNLGDPFPSPSRIVDTDPVQDHVQGKEQRRLSLFDDAARVVFGVGSSSQPPNGESTPPGTHTPTGQYASTNLNGPQADVPHPGFPSDISAHTIPANVMDGFAQRARHQQVDHDPIPPSSPPLPPLSEGAKSIIGKPRPTADAAVPASFPRQKVPMFSPYFNPRFNWRPITEEDARNIERIFDQHLSDHCYSPGRVTDNCGKCHTKLGFHEGRIFGVYLDGDHSPIMKGAIGKPRRRDWVVVRTAVNANSEPGYLLELLNCEGAPTKQYIGWVVGCVSQLKVARMLAVKHTVIAQVVTLHDCIYHDESEDNLLMQLDFSCVHYINDLRGREGPFKLVSNTATGLLKRKRGDSSSSFADTSDPYLSYDRIPENRHIIYRENTEKRRKQKGELNDQMSNGIKNQEEEWEYEFFGLDPELDKLLKDRAITMRWKHTSELDVVDDDDETGEGETGDSSDSNGTVTGRSAEYDPASPTPPEPKTGIARRIQEDLENALQAANSDQIAPPTISQPLTQQSTTVAGANNDIHPVVHYNEDGSITKESIATLALEAHRLFSRPFTWDQFLSSATAVANGAVAADMTRSELETTMHNARDTVIAEDAAAGGAGGAGGAGVALAAGGAGGAGVDGDNEGVDGNSSGDSEMQDAPSEISETQL
ncbi:hypothetical protein BJ508DRAFT_336736 [Ascobolus immersus RN42]|uniref:Uncharacterized protein n=1 Tax=Ascobolus immersus RN42 TaxID=1160509 RepID=A0A3N4HAB3_ASCIM|nr:hypothetical protein BJ508DRAFT_336736 [Ascobolus immersus RN42]